MGEGVWRNWKGEKRGREEEREIGLPTCVCFSQGFLQEFFTYDTLNRLTVSTIYTNHTFAHNVFLFLSLSLSLSLSFSPPLSLRPFLPSLYLFLSLSLCYFSVTFALIFHFSQTTLTYDAIGVRERERERKR